MNKYGSRQHTVTLDNGAWIYAAAIAGLILVKHQLAAPLPISPRPTYRTDDVLMVMMARNILKGNWLGDYSHAILMKGSFFPLFLAALNRLGLNYLGTLDLLYSFSALWFVHCVRPLMPRRWQRFILFAALLFNPATLAQLTFTRVYRNSISGMQTLFLFGTYYGLYLKPERKTGTKLAMLVFAGGTLFCFWNTREDAIWAAPFVAAATLLVFLSWLGYERERAGARFRPEKDPKAGAGSRVRQVCAEAVKPALFCLLPLIMLFAGNRIIAQVNRAYYGQAVRIETEGVFGDLMKRIYSIRPKEERKWTSVPAEKLERLYEASPTLASIRPQMDEIVESMDGNDLEEKDGNIEDGWFYWGFRKAVENAGKADTLTEASAFYSAVLAELNDALKSGDHDLQLQPVMPSPLMSPWRKGYFPPLMDIFSQAVAYLAGFRDVSADPRIEPLQRLGMSRLFEGITGNSFIFEDESGEINDLNGEYRQLYIDRANRVIGLGRAVNPVLAVLAGVLFVVFAVWVLIRRRWDQIPFLLVILGMLLSLAVMLLGIAYTELTAFRGLTSTYFSAGYPILLAAQWMVLLHFPERIKPASGKQSDRAGEVSEDEK